MRIIRCASLCLAVVLPEAIMFFLLQTQNRYFSLCVNHPTMRTNMGHRTNRIEQKREEWLAVL